VISGKQHWQQFMRLKAAAALGSGNGKDVLDGLRQQLGAGDNVEIAGYSISPRMAEGLAAAELLSGAGQGGRVAWLEMSARPSGEISPISLQRIVDARAVNGPAFWQTSEIEEAPALIEATLGVMRAWQ
jgi:hypothetical protein